MNRRTFLISGVSAALVIGAGATATSSGLLAGGTDDGLDSAEASSPELTTATVERGDLSAEREFNATVSFGDPWTVTTAATGTITQRHPVGTVVQFGETLARIDQKPLFLGQGGMPMYRELYKVASGSRDEYGNRLELMVGYDIGHLQTFLLAAGFDADGKLEVDGTFGSATEKAVKAWQAAVGLPVSGRVDNSQIVFNPEPLRIASESRIGATFTELEVNNAEAAVLVETSNRDRAALPIGAAVTVALPDGSELSGTVTEQKQETGSDGSRVWQTTITTNAEPPGDASTATVTVTEVLAENVLHVPVGALLALAEGGFAVEVPAGGSTNLVAVDVGEVLDGRAEVTGNIDEGTKVLVAT